MKRYDKIVFADGTKITLRSPATLRLEKGTILYGLSPKIFITPFVSSYEQFNKLIINEYGPPPYNPNLPDDRQNLGFDLLGSIKINGDIVLKLEAFKPDVDDRIDLYFEKGSPVPEFIKVGCE